MPTLVLSHCLRLSSRWGHWILPLVELWACHAPGSQLPLLLLQNAMHHQPVTTFDVANTTRASQSPHFSDTSALRRRRGRRCHKERTNSDVMTGTKRIDFPTPYFAISQLVYLSVRIRLLTGSLHQHLLYNCCSKFLRLRAHSVLCLNLVT